MKKILYVVGVIYLVLAVIITVGMLSYNEHNLSDFGGKVYVKAKSKLGSYNKGDLLIIKDRKDYVAGDNVFYCKLEKDTCVVSYGRIDSMMSGSPSITGVDVSNKLIIGIDRNVSVIPVMGTILNVLESNFGYLCFVILPLMLLFIYIISSISKEVKVKNKK